ncbi:hypothetical protein SISSUDRAFT_912524 [Sistotremastrum suecicum HHB10207 ss-3]|uniref:Uncharacterized protein n=1 Tax=Sistotremastrum suecicum HHB10207 ss-3 TaxID=1314776 RepID=A0A166C096_9AGAM|nr:hypothetical protein SISSUDRAFT_912524 [Sistotremastrum suecicum HHB10207 ss-3]
MPPLSLPPNRFQIPMVVIRRQAPSYQDTPLSLISQDQHSPNKFKRMQALLERSLRVSPGIVPTRFSPFGLESIYGTYGTAAPPFTSFNGQLLASYFSYIQQLYSSGARNFLFINVPVINLAPIV